MRNFSIPGGLTPDTDSEVNQSKLAIRDKLMNVNTTRNIRYNTLDVSNHIGQDSMPTKRNVHGRSALGNFHSSMSRKVGGRKGSMPAP